LEQPRSLVATIALRIVTSPNQPYDQADFEASQDAGHDLAPLSAFAPITLNPSETLPRTGVAAGSADRVPGGLACDEIGVRR
jgi:hypothetical protein